MALRGQAGGGKGWLQRGAGWSVQRSGGFSVSVNPSMHA